MTAASVVSAQPGRVTRAEVESFFINEAALLDEWRLNDWLQLFLPDSRYLIPPLDKPEGDYRNTLFLVSDDIDTLRSRVRQLLGRSTWSENPRSRTRRLLTNFRVLEEQQEEILITANFAVWRFQNDQTDVYVGRYMHRVVHGTDGRWMFRERKSVLDLEALRPHGKISFIL